MPRTYRVVLLDDSAALRSVVASGLAAAGHALRLAGSAEEAVAHLDEAPADVVLVDLDTPGLDPAAAVSALRPRCSRECPLVVLSDAVPEELGRRARALKTMGCLLSSRLPDELVVWMRKYRAYLERTAPPPRPEDEGPAPEEPARAARPSRPPGLGFEGVARDGGVLVVDDSVHQRFLLRDGLEEMGVAVVTTGTVAQGVAILKTFRPDLILLDVNLPDMQGDEVCTRIKRTNYKDTRVLLISGEATDTLRGLAEKAGADGYLVKPFSLKAVLEEIPRREPPPAPEEWTTKSILEGIASSEPQRRARALRAAGASGDRDLLPNVRTRLADPIPEVVAEALWAMGKLPDPTSLNDLAALLASEAEAHQTHEVRLRAIRTLQQIGGRQALELLAVCLAEGRPDEERIWAAQAIGELGDPHGREALQRVLFEDEGRVQPYARAALEKLQG